MPLRISFSPNNFSQVLVWEITEDFNELFRSVRLKDVSLARMEGMRSEIHQKGFLSVRKLLQTAGYTDFDLYYSEDGKPNLIDGKHISISHSFGFSAIVISENTVGLDLELRRDKVQVIARKFCEDEYCFLDPETKDYTNKLTVIWGVKEAIFKIKNEKGISFKDHIFVDPFKMSDPKVTAYLRFNKKEEKFNVFFKEIEDYTLVVAFPVHS